MAVPLILAGCGIWRDGTQDAAPQARGQTFSAFLNDLERDAARRGLDVRPLRAAYGEATPAPLPEARVAEKNQREFTDTYDTYVARAVSAARVARGRALLAQHREILTELEQETGVPAALMVALWGMESNYGRFTGNLPLIPTLASMAYKSPRHEMFRREVFAALQLPDAANLKGSWAGATGQCQFMPTNVLKHARDGNDDGLADIWGTEADVFASTANFVRVLGYQGAQPWRWRVKAPRMEGIKLNARGLSPRVRADVWQQRGVEVPPGFAADALFRLYQPTGAKGKTYLLGANYEAILGWNYSSFFATSVYLLAEAIAEGEI